MSKVKATNGVLVYKQFIQLEDGSEIQVRYNQKPELYEGTNVPLYAYTAKETIDGVKTEVTKYAVPFEQAKKATRTAVKDSILADVANGMSVEELLAKYRK